MTVTDLAPLPVPRPWWRRPGGLLVAAVVVASFLFWVYAFSGLAKRDRADKLTDHAFALQAEPVCRVAMDQIDQLPKANTAKTPAERADTIDAANGILAGMVGQLRSLPVSNDTDRRLVDAWLADWTTLLQDRQDYADAVRRDPRATFYVHERDRQAITEPMDNLAAVNDMTSCQTPQDVG